MLLREELVRCKNMRCSACVKGPSHGPYWYAYGRVNGRATSKYVGRARNREQARRMAEAKGITFQSIGHSSVV